jgi:hypothetical protein
LSNFFFLCNSIVPPEFKIKLLSRNSSETWEKHEIDSSESLYSFSKHRKCKQLKNFHEKSQKVQSLLIDCSPNFQRFSLFSTFAASSEFLCYLSSTFKSTQPFLRNSKSTTVKSQTFPTHNSNSLSFTSSRSNFPPLFLHFTIFYLTKLFNFYVRPSKN